MTIILIAAVGANGVIGRDNDLPWRIREDLQHFKQLTLGHTLVMGRKTYDSIGRPMKEPPHPLLAKDTVRYVGDHVAVVIADSAYQAKDAAELIAIDYEMLPAVVDVEDALKQTGDLYVAGGGEIYRQALPYADRLELTEVDQSPAGDVTFPSFNRSEWQETARDRHDGFTFVTYDRV